MASTALRMSDFSVSMRVVDSVDNQGEPCERCGEVDAVNAATVYGRSYMDIIDLTTDCCAACVPDVVMSMSVQHPVIVEMLAPVQADDRMHNQDCECAHPDAL